MEQNALNNVHECLVAKSILTVLCRCERDMTFKEKVSFFTFGIKARIRVWPLENLNASLYMKLISGGTEMSQILC
jgi:hypothetical protein